MDTNKDMMESLSPPDTAFLPDAEEKKANAGLPPNGSGSNIQNNNSFQNRLNNNIPNQNSVQNSINGNIPNHNLSQNGFNSNNSNNNPAQNNFNNNIPNRSPVQNNYYNNIPNTNPYQNNFNNNIPNRSPAQNNFNNNIPNRSPVQNNFNNNIPNINPYQNGFNNNIPNNRQPVLNRRQNIKPKPPLSKEEMTKMKVKQFYNRTGACLLLHDVLIFIIQIFLGIVLAFSSFAIRDVKDYLADENTSAGLAVASVMSYVAANIICAFLGLSLTKRVKEFPKLYCAPKINPLTALLAFPAILGFQGVIAVLHQGYFWVMNLDVSSEATVNDMSQSVMIVYFIYSVILAPVTEEIFFRGMILKNLSVVDERFAIFFSAFLFGLFHENIPQMITATILGAFLAYVAIKTDSIILPTLLHMFNNLYAEVSSMFPDSKTKTAVLLALYGTGIVSAVIFYILTRKKESAQNNYKPLFETLPHEERGLKLSAALSAPAVIIYLVLIMVLLSFEMILTFLVSWLS